jgi:low temperature requirement protein LtrA
VLAAADGYSYLHLPLVAGIVVFAVGVRIAVEELGEPLGEAARLALCGGVALYLVGHAAFRLRMVQQVNAAELVTAVAVLVLFAVGGGVAAWLLVGIVAALVLGLSAVEAVQQHG